MADSLILNMRTIYINILRSIYTYTSNYYLILLVPFNTTIRYRILRLLIILLVLRVMQVLLYSVQVLLYSVGVLRVPQRTILQECVLVRTSDRYKSCPASNRVIMAYAGIGLNVGTSCPDPITVANRKSLEPPPYFTV